MASSFPCSLDCSPFLRIRQHTQTHIHPHPHRHTHTHNSMARIHPRTWPWMSPQTVTGLRTGCTLHSSIKISLTCSSGSASMGWVHAACNAMHAKSTRTRTHQVAQLLELVLLDALPAPQGLDPLIYHPRERRAHAAWTPPPPLASACVVLLLLRPLAPLCDDFVREMMLMTTTMTAPRWFKSPQGEIRPAAAWGSTKRGLPTRVGPCATL